jgi:hypothetical protein
MPQKKKTTWGIIMIYPLVRWKCSREDCRTTSKENLGSRRISTLEKGRS